MKVKVLIPICFAFLVSSLFVACSTYDDTDLKNQIEELDGRVSKLEATVSQMNTNISSYLKTVEALENGDRILSVAPLEDGTGYTITFSKTGTITIYNGNDGDDGAPGKDGSTPEIGVKLDVDGTYYWTVNGEYLLDNNGNKIAATSHISTPQVKLSADGKHYEISFDNGTTWMTVGDVVGTGSGDTIFTGVNDGAEEVTFFLTDGTTIIIPKLQLFALNISNLTIGVSADSFVEIPYTITAADVNTVVDGIGSNGYKVTVVPMATAAGIVVVQAPNPLVEGKAIILAVNGKGTTSGKILSFEQGNLVLITDGATVDASGGIVNIQIKTNLTYYINIPDDASWISYVETKALRDDTLSFSVKENTGAERSATIQLVDAYDEVLQSFTIIQKAGGGDNPNEGYTNPIDDWEYDDPISV